MDDLNFDVDLTTPLDGCLVNDFIQPSLTSIQHNSPTIANNSPVLTNSTHLHNQQQISRQQVNYF